MRKENFMTFNLKYDFMNNGDLKWNNRCDKIIKIIKDNNPLIIGTQEGLEHMLLDMNNKLNDYLYVGEGRGGNKEGEFNAVFYKNKELKLIDLKQFWLSETPQVIASKSWNTACERICTYAIFEKISDKSRFMVYNTHLDHESSLARVESIKLIMDKCKENYLNNNIPFIITGDFNCNETDEVLEIIKSYNSDVFKVNNLYSKVKHTIKGTFHNFTGILEEGVIDYILASGEFECEKLWCDERIIDGGFASDHFPVIATLKINTSKKE